jgi:hypothetical protein
MGSSSSVQLMYTADASVVGDSSLSLWSADEIKQNEEALRLQNKTREFLCKYVFYGVAVRGGKKSSDPMSPLWLEPSPRALEDARTDPIMMV